MIKVLGAKRVLVLLILIATNAGLAATAYMYLQPALKKEEMTLKASKTKERKTRQDISSLQLEFDQLAAQQDEFDVLKADGFFSNQDRRQIQELFLTAEEKSGVLSATVTIKSGTIIEDEEAVKADHVILESRVDVTITSIDDTDVYMYIDFLNNNFPGHLTIRNVYMRRMGTVTDTILRAVAGGGKPPLVEARLELIWRTMVEREDVLDVTNSAGGAIK